MSQNVSRPTIKATLGHRYATDTAIAWRNKKPANDQPPNNVPQFPGQLVAVPVAGSQCRLYVGAEDQSRWYEVV